MVMIGYVGKNQAITANRVSFNGHDYICGKSRANTANRVSFNGHDYICGKNRANTVPFNGHD